MPRRSELPSSPPLGLDPESHLLQRERVERTLGVLRAHRFAAAFLARALEERPWQELAAEVGAEPNTLSKAWTRLVRQLDESTRGGRHGDRG